MKTIIENNFGLNQWNTTTADINYLLAEHNNQERSCFYDFGARSSVEFSGFVNSGDSAFIDEIGKCFK